MRLTPSTATLPLRMKSGASDGGIAHGQPVAAALGAQVVDHPDAVDVAEHEVAAEPAVGRQRPLEIDPLAARQRAERGDAGGLGPDIGVQFALVRDQRRQADAGDGDAVARVQDDGQRRSRSAAGSRRPSA